MDGAQESSLQGLFLSREGTKGGSGDCDMTSYGQTLTSPRAGASFKAANSPCPFKGNGQTQQGWPSTQGGFKRKAERGTVMRHDCKAVPSLPRRYSPEDPKAGWGSPVL